MVKKQTKIKDEKEKAVKGEPRQGREAEVQFNFGLGGLFGGLFKGVEKLVDLAEKAEKVGSELKREGEWRGGTKKDQRERFMALLFALGLGKLGRVSRLLEILKKPNKVRGLWKRENRWSTCLTKEAK